MTKHRGRGRILATAVTSGVLVAAATTITTGPAGSAAPEGDCAQPYPVADVTRDQAVHGLTVTRGTTLEGFTGTILGVLEDGIAPGLDMIMADLTNPTVDQVGIWQGMSGSPVYAEDGRLIGAVAYGLSWGPSTVAGITPFEEMDEYSTTRPAATIEVNRTQARRIARSSEVSAAEAREGFEQLPMPLATSGAYRINRDLTRKERRYLLPKARGTAGTAAVAEDTMVAGGNLAATLSYGDLTMAGVGTVTSVCAGEVIGFGHPMTFAGRTTMGLSPADAVHVQDDPVGPGFKLANVGEPIGTITQDRLTGISGPLGATPRTTAIATDVSLGARSRQLLSHTTVSDHNADVVFTQGLANHDRVVDAITEGSTEVAYRATGTDAGGRDFSVVLDDRYQSDWDISFEALWDSADITWLLGGMRGVTVDEVVMTSQVSEDAETFQVRQLQVRRAGAWHTVTRRDPIAVRAGSVLALRAKLVSPDGSRHVRLDTRIPARAAGSGGYLEVSGGGSMWSDLYDANTPQALSKELAAGPRNDEVRAHLHFARRAVADKKTTSNPQSRVVHGSRFAELIIR